MPLGKPLAPESPCPCGSPETLDDCCLPYINGLSLAPTAETLMRSRYTAHITLAIHYLWDTWSTQERIRSSKEDIEAWAASCEWLGLKIVKTRAGRPQDNQGIVEFIALYRQNGQLQQHHEISLFRKSHKSWLYVGHQDSQPMS